MTVESDRKRKTILVVDNSPEEITALRSILGQNHLIRSVVNGKVALEAATREPVPDLILLDVMMPEMEGFAVCRQLKTDQRTRDIPVIFMTGTPHEADDFLGLELGAADYLSKPFSAPILRARVKTHLELRQAILANHCRNRRPSAMTPPLADGDRSTETGTVLIVDDALESIDVIRKALSAHFQILVATNGRMALKVARQTQPDVILLDILMPDLDGYETCKQLKSIPGIADIPILFLTAKGDSEDETRGLALGATDYIRKPSRASIVLARVRNTYDLLIARRELEKRNRELEEALKIREDVERMVRHDLKGPLAGIIGAPELLMEDANLTDGQKALLKMITRSGYTLLEMINRSTDLIKMESGHYTLQRQFFDIHEKIRKILADLQISISSKNIQAIIRNGSGSGSRDEFLVSGEKMLCYPMLYNLLLNAVEASPHDGVVEVTLYHRGDHDEIRITNSGAVPEEIRQRFFEKYVTSGKKMGTGLGTYSAWLVAKTHGGDVSLDSSREGMTTVTVRLPAFDPTQPQES
ncbi:MAG: response regulator [Magnetococcales bacterium]|nr:response regulator [Magnetococcales bacterium]